jgi:DNA invertase Pin-like site-specific DNA recombinase
LGLKSGIFSLTNSQVKILTGRDISGSFGKYSPRMNCTLNRLIVLDFPLLDTRRSTDGVTGAFISDLILQILSYVAQVGRENTHQRQLEGIREAKKRGVQFSRPRIPIPEQFDEVAKQIRDNKMSLRQVGKILGVSYTTLWNWRKAQNRADS